MRARIQTRHPAIYAFFVAAERSGYRLAWHQAQNLTLYYDNMLRPRDRLLGGWNADRKHWYIALRHVHGATAEIAGNLGFEPSRVRRDFKLPGAENLAAFQRVIEHITGKIIPAEQGRTR